MTKEKMPPIADLIAQTPGAQSRAQALARIDARRQKRSAKRTSPSLSDEHISKPEPLPIIDNPDQFAAGFFQRMEMKEMAKRLPPKRSKPKLVVDNDKPRPSDGG